MTEQEDEIRLKDLLDIYSKEQYKEIIEILNRDQKRYHKEQLILSGVVHFKIKRINNLKLIKMSKFQKRIDSKMRINELEKVFINTIEDFSNKNLDLTMNEVAAVMLKMLTQANDSEIKEAIT